MKKGQVYKVLENFQQNGIHKWLPRGRQQYYLGYDNFQYGTYGYFGYYSPFSLY